MQESYRETSIATRAPATWAIGLVSRRLGWLQSENSLANRAFEHFEAASDKSSLTLAKLAGGNWALTALKLSLSDEQWLTRWYGNDFDATSRKYAGSWVQGTQVGV